MIRQIKPLLIILITFLISTLFPFQRFLFADTAKPFSDLPSDIMYYPAIEVFQQENIIIGDTTGGSPTGKLRPGDYLTRAEFTKVATLVHLLERVQTSEAEGSLSDFLGADLNDFTLKTDALLRPYYTSRPGSPKFKDVPEKDINCAMDAGGCEPWFTQYVNYMASLGTIKGYTEDKTFRPNDTILRIHALKMVMAGNGGIPAEKDEKFRRLAENERVKSRSPRCLVGAEDTILEANGGAGLQDSQNLLAYALLADKLDIFGNRCQFFEEKNAHTASARAELLQKPLTRGEIARYLALTTTIPELQLDPSTDSTVDSRYEYIGPVVTEKKKEKEDIPKVEDERRRSDEQSDEADGKEKETEPEIIHLNKPVSDLSIAEQAAMSKTGRCCKTKDLYPASNCKIITYATYSISEENDYNWELYGGPVWHKATSSRDECWVPYTDILEGYDEDRKQAEALANAVRGTDRNMPINDPDKTDLDISKLVVCSLLSPECWIGMKDKAGALKNIGNGNAALSDYKTLGISEEAVKKAKPELPPNIGTDYWYSVIPGWQTANDGLWGGVFSKKQYSKTYLTDTLFPEKSGDKYKEFIVKVLGKAESYDSSDPDASKNKAAMTLNYRTDRWYRIYYINPAKPDEGLKTGWVPVSGLILKDDIFKVIENGFYIFDYYNSIHGRGYGNTTESKVGRLILHNTGGSTAVSLVKGIYSPPHYYLGRDHQNDKNAGMDNRFVGYVPEYLGSGTVNETGADIEKKSVSVEMVNWEWWNPALKADNQQHRMVINGLFHEFDLEKMKQYEIGGKGDSYSHSFETIQDFTRVIDGKTMEYRDYDLVNYYFSEKNGFFEVFNIPDASLPPEGIALKKQLREDKKVFERFYNDDKNQNGENAFILRAEYTDLVTANSDPYDTLQPLYEVLSKIPFGYKYYNYKQQSSIDFSQVIDGRGTYPFAVYSLENASRVGKLTDGRIGDYYERYTSQQYANLNTFISHMNAKYAIPMNTFKYSLPEKIPQKYGFYMYDTSIPWENMRQKTLASSEGIFSHRSIQQGGKMCPSPGFQIDRITVIKNQ